MRKYSRKLDGYEPKIEHYENGAKVPLKFEQLNLLQVLKNEGPEKGLKPGSYLVVEHDERDTGLPGGDFTAYLVADHPDNYKPGIFEYCFIGDKAFADQKVPGNCKEGISHVGPASASVPREAKVELSLESAGTLWTTPKPGEEKKLDDLVLNVTNRTDRDIWFEVGGDTRFVMKDASGRVLNMDSGQEGERVVRPLHLGPGKAGSYHYTASMALPHGSELPKLYLRDPTSFFNTFHDLRPGKYTLQLAYQCHDAKLGGMSQVASTTRSLAQIRRCGSARPYRTS